MRMMDYLACWPTEADAIAALSEIGWTAIDENETEVIRPYAPNTDWMETNLIVVKGQAAITDEATGEVITPAIEEVLFEPDLYWLALCCPENATALRDQIKALDGCIIEKPRAENLLTYFSGQYLGTDGPVPISLAHIKGCAGMTHFWAKSTLDLSQIEMVNCILLHRSRTAVLCCG